MNELYIIKNEILGDSNINYFCIYTPGVLGIW